MRDQIRTYKTFIYFHEYESIMDYILQFITSSSYMMNICMNRSIEMLL